MEKLLKKINILTNQYIELNIEQSLNWQQFNQYAIVHHSTSIEGSSLTQEETDLFLSEEITAKGKPLLHHLMQKDHFDALKFILNNSIKNTPLSIDFIKKTASLIMKNTGGDYNTISGSFNSCNGDLRLVNVYAGQTNFPDFKKVPVLLRRFCDELNNKLNNIDSSDDILITSFDAHFNLVSIHPFADGNGRVSRLIMNYIQNSFDLPLSIVFKEDKADYYKALIETREKEDINIFRFFMLNQHIKFLTQEIDKVLLMQNKVSQILKSDETLKKRKGFGLGLLF